MSWCHATSTDLSHWEEQAVVLLARGFPGDITEIFFTGRAVADVNNVSGLGTNGKIPLIAVHTSFVSPKEVYLNLSMPPDASSLLPRHANITRWENRKAN